MSMLKSCLALEESTLDLIQSGYVSATAEVEKDIISNINYLRKQIGEHQIMHQVIDAGRDARNVFPFA